MLKKGLRVRIVGALKDGQRPKPGLPRFGLLLVVSVIGGVVQPPDSEGTDNAVSAEPQMRIYIDEAGGFVVPPPTRLHSFSLVLALAFPSASEADLFNEFLRLRDGWPIRGVEIKGSTLDESRAAQVIDLLCRYNVLVNFFALDMTTHNERSDLARLESDRQWRDVSRSTDFATSDTLQIYSCEKDARR